MKKRIFFCLIVIISHYLPAQKITTQEYIEKYKDIAIKEMIKYKIPASITLAQGLLESNNGNSELAVNANNHFGIKCHLDWEGATYYQDDDEKDECFRKYKDAEESFKDHSKFLSTKTRYDNLFELEITDYKGWAKRLKDDGYATNKEYDIKLINIIETNNLQAYDLENNKSLSVKKGKDKYQNNTTGNRKILTRNDVRYIIARNDDTFMKIAKELDIGVWQIYKYNDLKKTDHINADDIIYIQPKKRKGTEEYHIVKQGETMQSISQLYCIKLKHLYRKNNMTVGTQASAGQKLWLRSKKTN